MVSRFRLNRDGILLLFFVFIFLCCIMQPLIVISFKGHSAIAHWVLRRTCHQVVVIHFIVICLIIQVHSLVLYYSAVLITVDSGQSDLLCCLYVGLSAFKPFRFTSTFLDVSGDLQMDAAFIRLAQILRETAWTSLNERLVMTVCFYVWKPVFFTVLFYHLDNYIINVMTTLEFLHFILI